MNKKQQKELLKEVNNHNLEPLKYYSARDFRVGGNWHIWTNEEGKAVAYTLDPDEHKRKTKEKEIQILAAKSLKKEDETRRKKTLKSKKELDEYKEDSSVLQEELDAKYLKYQEKVKEMNTWYEGAKDKDEKPMFPVDNERVVDKKKPEHAPGRVINRAKISALKDLYDTAKIYNSLKKDDDPTDYYGEAVKAVTNMPTTSVEDPSQIKSLPKTEDIYSDDPAFREQSHWTDRFTSGKRHKEFTTKGVEVGTKKQRTLTDQEILDKLKLRQK